MILLTSTLRVGYEGRVDLLKSLLSGTSFPIVCMNDFSNRVCICYSLMWLWLHDFSQIVAIDSIDSQKDARSRSPNIYIGSPQSNG